MLTAGASCLPASSSPTAPVATARPAPTRALPRPTAVPSPTLTATPLPTLAPTPAGDLEDLSLHEAAMRPDFTADVYSLPQATRYRIVAQVTYAPDGRSARIQGMARIRYTNQARRPLEDFALVLWPNEEQYRSQMQAGPVLVKGETVVPQVTLDGLALRFRLPEPLAPGEALDLSLPFSVEASGPIGGPNPRRFGLTGGVFAAPTFYPMVPRLVGGQWDLVDPPPGGDTTNSEIAFYHVTLEVPANLALAASGVEIDRRERGTTVRATYVTGPVRDFAFALGPLDLHTRQAGEVTLNAWVLPEHADEASRLLRLAQDQLVLLERLVGPYPYRELDLVDAPGAFGGIEYPTLVFIGTLGGPGVTLPTVHEVAHQWFYGLIGNDQVREPWLDEAAASYAEALYYEFAVDSGRGTRLLSDFRVGVRTAADPARPVGQPVGAYPSIGEYARLVYLKGALFFETLRNEMGDERFFAFLQRYYQTRRYGFASSADFQTLAEAECACDLDALFDLWVYEGGPLPEP